MTYEDCNWDHSLHGTVNTKRKLLNCLNGTRKLKLLAAQN